jgi:hypothetical protein
VHYCYTGEIVHPFPTSPDIEMDSFCKRGIFEQLIIPIDIRENIRIQSGSCPGNLVGSIRHISASVIGDSFVE